MSSLLFLIYLNDIENNIKSDISLFADDVALLNQFENNNTLENEINRDLETLNEWADKWNMDFNPTKTKMVIFSNKHIKSKPKIQLKGEQIEQVSSHKHLGVFLSQDMKWTTHIDHSIKKVKKKLGLLRRQSRNLLNKQKIDIYKTIIRPVFEYGSILFDNCSIGDSLKLEVANVLPPSYALAQ